MDSKVVRLNENTVRLIETVRNIKLELSDDEIFKNCIKDCSYDYLISYIVGEYLRSM